MIPRGSRLALCCLALLLTTLMLVKGRVPARKGEDAAFVVPGPPGTVTVRLAGSVANTGIYRFPVGTSVSSAIKMTLPRLRLAAPDPALAAAVLHSGDIISIKEANGQGSVFSMDSMGGRERMLLGIPLDPDRLTAEEWELLPGIGPALARRIVDDRQKNGVFRGVQGVLRVPGIGAGKLKAIKRYF